MMQHPEPPDPARNALLHYSCPRCQAQLKAPSQLAGTRQTCPTCQQSIQLPGIPRLPSPSADPTIPVSQDVNIPASARLALTCTECGKRAFARGSQLGETIVCENCLEDILVVATQAEDTEPIPQAPSVAELEPASSPGVETLAPDEPPPSAPSVQLTSDDLVPEPPPVPSPPAQPVDQVYDLANVDLDTPPDESLHLADPLPRRQISLEGLAAGPGETRSSEEILRSLGSAPTIPAPPAGQPDGMDSYSFGINCLLCGTRLYVGSRDIGTEIRCPDCHSHTLIREPRKENRAPTAPRPAEQGPIPLSPAPMPDNSAVTPERDRVHQSMEKARAELESEQGEFKERALKGWWGTIFSSLFQLDILIRMILQTVTGFLGIWIYHASQDSSFFLILYPISFFFLITTGINLVISVMTIIPARADGVDEVENWPSVILLEWIGIIPYLGVGLFVAAIPQIVWIPLTHEILDPAIVLAVGIMTTLLLFAPVILATLSAGTPVAILHSTIIASIALRPGPWVKFVGFVLLVSPIMTGSLALLAEPSALAAAAGVTGFIVTLFFYAHVVGMLGFQLSRYRDGDPLDRMHDPAGDQE